MPAAQPSYPATPDTSHPAFTGSTNQLLTFGDAGGWAVNNGSGIGSPTVNGTTSSINNALGDALVFDGTSTYISYPSTNIPVVEWTLLWGGIFDTNDSPRGFMDCTVNGVSGWNIYQGGTGTMYCNNSSYPAGNPSTGWTNSIIINGAVRNKGGTGFAWFRDGVQVATGTGFSPAAATVPLWIGRLKVGGLPYIKGKFNYLYLFDKYLDDATIASIAADPYAIFLASGGGTTFTITPSGGIVFSGGIPTYREKILAPSGGLTMAGNAILNKEKIVLPNGGLVFSGDTVFSRGRVITPTGNIVFGGSSAVIKEKVIIPSGKVTFGGTAPITGTGAITYIITPSGGVTLSGSSVLIKTHINLPSGRIVFSGSAPITSNTIIATVSTRMPLTGVGQ